MWDDQYKERYKNGIPLAAAGFTSTWERWQDLYSGTVIEDPRQAAVMRSVAMHSHAEPEILCILEGSALFTVDGRAFTAAAGDMVVVNPYQVHYSVSIPEVTRYSHACICFSHTLLSDTAGDTPGPSYRIVNHIPASSGTSGLQKLVLEIIDAYLEEKPGWEYMVRGRMYLLFGTLISAGMVQYNTSFAGENAGFTAEVIRYIDTHLSGVLSIREAAGVFSYTDAYFCRVFKRHFGCTFTQFCHNRRIYSAQRLFNAGKTNVLEVANAVGIPNCSYFARLFRQILGILPSDYIKMLRGNG